VNRSRQLTMTRWVVRLILSCLTINCNAAVIAESIHVDRPLAGLNGRLSGADEVHNTHVFKESMPLLASRTDLIKKARPDDDYIHEVIFAVKMNNMDDLTRMLHDISDPDSPNYGQHLKKEEMHDFISNPEACTEVISYLQDSGATAVSESLGCEYITAKAPIAVWEKMFKTDFFVFQQTHSNGETHEVVRAEHYSAPNEIHDHIEAVMNTIEMPILTYKRPKKIESDEAFDESRRLTGGVFVDGLITPARLRDYYNMSDSHGSSLSTQAVYANAGNYFSPSDLAAFQRLVSEQPLQPAIGNFNRSLDPTFDNTEGNLDLQYMMSISPGSPTRYLHRHASIGVWVSNLADTVNIPWVLSVSYGAYEDSTSSLEMNTFTRAAIRMGIMGVTIVVASGDYGAGDTHYDRKTCRYNPFFPASSPYVISVGATKVITLINIL
jgi:tripeptidyl-peptidase I